MERRRMAQQSKREYLESIFVRYRQSRRVEKQRILDEFVRVCGYHRKYAIGLLNRPLPERRPRRVPTRRPRYSAAVIERLAELWTASGYLCAARLKAAADNAGSATGLGGVMLAIAPLKAARAIESKLSAELKSTVHLKV